jgi:hypothetical protein
VYSVFDAESEKMNEVENVAYFEKDVFFEKKRHPSSISYFSIGRKHLLKLNSSFS